MGGVERRMRTPTAVERVIAMEQISKTHNACLDREDKHSQSARERYLGGIAQRN